MTRPVLSIEGLDIVRASDGVKLVDGASFQIEPGQVCALVGESGSGKTLISRSIIGLLPPGLAVAAGRLVFAGAELTSLPAAAWRRVRGAAIGMVFQEPMVSLNPAMRIGAQMIEALQLHRSIGRTAAEAAACEMLERFKVPDAAGCLARYPHEFSGGLRQRILLAAVMMLRPKLLLADEPTTALDAIVQKEVLDDMVSVARELGTAVLLVTHDLGVVARYSDRLVVINRGRIEEQGETTALLTAPAAAYTRRLLASVPARRTAPSSRETAPLLRVSDLKVAYPGSRASIFGPRLPRPIVKGVSFEVGKGELVGLVGESGSGKTTIGRAILGLTSAQGRVDYGERNLLELPEADLRPLRRRLQLIFQDPYASLNPRQSVATIIGAGLWELPTPRRRERVEQLLDEVGLGSDFAQRFPHQLSGGQRQRVSIARALAVEPEFLVADEPVSALDVTVQAQILDLFLRLRERRGFGCLFISHDLAVVRAICDRVLVISEGHIVEAGPVDDVLERPTHPYTKRLIEAFPQLDLPGAAPAEVRRTTINGRTV